MKRLLVILLLCAPFCLKAQSPVFLLDGKKADKAAIDAVTPNDIAINTLTDPAAAALAGTRDTAYVVTKKYAVAKYEEKVSLLSDDLESYYTGHGADDANLVYYINDVPLAKDKEEAAKLYFLPKDNIDSVVFVQDEPEGSPILGKIKITTKK